MDKVLRFFNVKKKQKQKAEDVSIKTDLAAGKSARQGTVEEKEKPKVEKHSLPGPKKPPMELPKLATGSKPSEEEKQRIKEEKARKKAEREARKAEEKKRREEERRKRKEEEARLEAERKKQAAVKQKEMDKKVREEREKASKETADTKMSGLKEFIQKSKNKSKEKKAKKALEDMKEEEKAQVQLQANTIVAAMMKRAEEKAQSPEKAEQDLLSALLASESIKHGNVETPEERRARRRAARAAQQQQQSGESAQAGGEQAAAAASGTPETRPPPPKQPADPNEKPITEAEPEDEEEEEEKEAQPRRRRDRIRKGAVGFVFDDREANKPRFAINILTYGNPNPDFSELFGDVSKPGLYRWRIEAFDPVPLKRDDVVFHTEDAYIVLSVPDRPESQHWMIQKEEQMCRLHIWLGRGAQADKRTAAAIRAVQLNTHCGGAKHYCEEEGAESDQFKSYYFGAFRLEAGGTPSGFRHVEPPPHQVRLYVLFHPARGLLHVREVALQKSSLNAHHALVCEAAPDQLLVWTGEKAPLWKQYAAVAVAQAINRFELRGRAQITVMRQGDAAEVQLYRFLEGTGAVSNEPLAMEALAENDALYGTYIDEEGNFSMSIVWQASEGGGLKSLKRELLASRNAFLLDAGLEVIVWHGLRCTAKERASMLAIANKIAGDKGVSFDTVIDTVERIAFRLKFADWLRFAFPPRHNPRRVAQPLPAPEVNAKALLMPALSALVEEQITTTDGTLNVWVQDGNFFEPLPEEERGIFFAGNTYVVMFCYYDDAGKQRYVTYYWIGATAPRTAWSRFLNGLNMLLEPKIRQATGAAPILVRVPQQQEPEHFMQLFKGHLVINQGRRVDHDASRTVLYHARVFSERRAYAIQVPARASSLHSRDAFILRTPNSLYLWSGKKSNNPKLHQLYALVQPEGVSAKPMTEGEELPSFWETLGQKEAYSCDAAFAEKYNWTRLLQLSHSTGAFRATEVPNFSQVHLEETETYLLDAFHEVYLWVGSRASHSLFERVSRLAEEFAREASAARGKQVPLKLQHEFEEEPEFTRHFYGWSRRERVEDPRAAGERRLRQLEREEYERAREEAAKRRELVRLRAVELHKLYLAKLEEAKAAAEAIRAAEEAAKAAETEREREEARRRLEEEKARLVVQLPPVAPPKQDEDLEDIQDEIEEAKVLHSAAQAPKEPCAGCGRNLAAAYITALDRKWHPDCFVCVSCKRGLVAGYLEGKGQPYCAPCHAKAFGEPCAGCGKPLEAKRLAALGKHWHHNCFRCTNCGADVADGYVEENGMPYCEACDDKLFSEPCTRCGKPLGGEFLVALERKWHQACWTCTNCNGAQGSLDDGVIVGKDGEPYCEACDPEKCAVCGKGLGSKRIAAAGLKLHSKCYVCANCHRPDSLADGFLEEEGKLYCEPCYDKLFTVPCAACGRALEENCIGLGSKGYHQSCFVCAKCRVSLKPEPDQFIEKQGRLFCKEHDPTPPAAAKGAEAAAEEGPICPACAKPCGPRRLAALDKKWHTECFVCQLCRGSLATGYFARNNLPYCAKCKDNVATVKSAKPAAKPADKPAAAPSSHPAESPTPTASVPAPSQSPAAAAPSGDLCPMCQKPLGPKRVAALDKKWHPECFVCFNCKGSVDDGFFERNGMPYCEKCKSAIPRPQSQPQPAAAAPATSAPAPAPAASGDACPSCGKPLGPKRVTALDKKWHPECFVCQKCRASLDDGFYERRGLPYCDKCIKTIPK